MIYEFFCGIGGLHFGLERLLKELSATVDLESKLNSLIQSYDINPNTNQTYQLNFKKVEQKDIQNVPLSGGIWLLSPPCQPFTRTGNQLDIQDPRCKGLLFLIENISIYKPFMIFMENVVGFEQSTARELLLKELKEYTVKEYLISPIQLGIPNDRPRYYLFAYLPGFHSFFIDLLESVGITLDNTVAKGSSYKTATKVSSFTLSTKPVIELTESQKNLGLITDLELLYDPKPLKEYLDTNVLPLLPEHLYKSRFGFDVTAICHPNSFTSPCFTKAYGKHSVYSGGFLQTKSLDGYDPELLNNPKECVEELGLRLFTPTEIQKLQGFWDLRFPDGVKDITKYKMLGNSMSVDVVYHALRHAWLHSAD